MPPPLIADFDNTMNGGFGIICYYESGKRNIIIGVDSIFSYNDFNIQDTINKNVRVSLANLNDTSKCRRIGTYYDFEKITGKVKLIKIDVPNGIFSGTFDFTIKTKDCGNYEVTNGRFDYKF